MHPSGKALDAHGSALRPGLAQEASNQHNREA